MKVLLADTDPERASLLADRFGAAGAGTVTVRTWPGEALPDRDALDGIRRVARVGDPRPVAMFVDRDNPAYMEAPIEAGVSSCDGVGAALPDVKPIVAAAVALLRRHRRVLEELRRAETSLKERAVIEEAKAVLMGQRRPVRG